MAANDSITLGTKALPPVWLMGMTNMVLGTSGAVSLLVTPQLLAAAHVPEPRIAAITGLSLAAGWISVPFSPILDVRFSRKTYAIVFTLLSGLLGGWALAEIGNPALLGWLLFAGSFAVSLAVGAAGGWIGSLASKTDDARLASWFTVANIGGFGVVSVVGAGLMRALPPGVGALALGALIASPALVCLLIPGPPPDRRLASESFGQFFGDIARLVRRPSVLMTVALFASPAAAFALTNTLGGLGHDYGASEQFVSLAGGAAITIVGVVTSLLAPKIGGGAAPQWLYLAIGATGSLFTLTLLALPHTPAMFLIAMIGENIAQSAAFAVGTLVIFAAMGKDNPLAATEYSILTAAVLVPLTYMQVLDGQAYGAMGLKGAYLMDAGLGLAACGALALMLRFSRLRG
jgi:PAT family beta-lactamase induction signal transducer AmpG